MCCMYHGWRDGRVHTMDLPIFKHMGQLLLRRIEGVAVSNPEHYII